MFKKLLKLFKRTSFEDFPLEFTLDIDDDEKYIAEVFMITNEGKEKIKDIRKIWNYGFSVEKGTKKYVLSTKNLETILSLRSLNPLILDDGKMIFDVCPPQLRFLRTRDNIVESNKSKEIKILDKPLEHGAKIDYDPDKGLILNTGYFLDGNDKLISANDLNLTHDKDYVRVRAGNVFAPIPIDIDTKIKNWLNIENKIISSDGIPDFFKRDLVLLKSKMKTALTENAQKINIIDDVFKPLIKVKSNDSGWLDFEIDYSVGKYQIPHDLFKKGENNKFIHPDVYTWIHTDNKTIKNTEKYLQELEVEETSSGYRTPIIHFISLEEFIEKIGGIKEVNAEYNKFLSEITDFKSDDKFRLPEDIETRLISEDIKLRPYQRAGIHWLNWLLKHHLNGILADDMGLGKTIQTIATISMYYQNNNTPNHSLIICPKSVVFFWEREIKRCSPNLWVIKYVGANRNKKLFNNSRPLIFVTSYETASRDIEIIRSIPFDFIILDEATKIKNPSSKRTKAIKQINAMHRIALSGTPIENRPAELWSLFDFLMKGHLGTYGNFIQQFEIRIMDNDDDAAKRLSKRIRPFLLRRLKKDVAQDLPEKIEMDNWCNLTDEQKSLYSQIQNSFAPSLRKALMSGESINYTSNILPILTKLKQVCDHPALITGEKEPVEGRSEKFDMILEKIEEIRSAGESVVLFSHFLETLNLFEIAFKPRKIGFIRIDGATVNREKLIDKFNAKNVDVALCSIQACGQGITLTAANHVIHVDRWWNPAIEDQATDRVHRIGQDKTVYVYRIITSGTLEEKIASLLDKKRNISDKVIGSAMKQKMQWTKEELLELLKPLE